MFIMFVPPLLLYLTSYVTTNHQTPNHILKTDDVPPRYNRTQMSVTRLVAVTHCNG
jgi:hypothetical protein